MPWALPSVWKAAPSQLTLGDNDVHLWLVATPDAVPELARLRDMLSADERERSEQFHFERDRDRYVIARGVLRDLLGRYLGTRKLAFTTNQFGKPSLQEPREPIEFNVSHSRDLALFGLTRGRPIGVDVEWIRPDFATLEIANRFFAQDEARVLAGLAEEDRPSAFFHCWTRKEAYIKARGVGLSLGLDTFSVTLKPGEPAALLRDDKDRAATARWTILSVETGLEYRAAAAFESRACQITHYRWGPNPS